MLDLARINFIDLEIKQIYTDKDGLNGSEFLVQMVNHPETSNQIKNLTPLEFSKMRLHLQKSIVSQLSKRALMAQMIINQY